MKTTPRNHVTLKAFSVAGGRVGTCRASESRLVELFGVPVRCSAPDAKVTRQWTFSTPRGPVEVRDYWWNAADEWSIAASNGKAALWVAAMLRSHNLRAAVGREVK